MEAYQPKKHQKQGLLLMQLLPLLGVVAGPPFDGSNRLDLVGARVKLFFCTVVASMWMVNEQFRGPRTWLLALKGTKSQVSCLLVSILWMAAGE